MTQAQALPLDAPQLGLPAEDVKKPADGDMRLWSVTTIIGALDKPALLYWSAEQTALAAIDSERVWKAMLDDRGKEEAVTWLRDARFRGGAGQLSAASLGTVVHACCEEYALTGVRPDRKSIGEKIRAESPKLPNEAIQVEGANVELMLDRFDEWLSTWQPSYQAAEVTVYSPTYGYAGTCDGFLTVDGTRAIIDYKTSKRSWDKQGKPTGPYPEVALQLAAYRYAEGAAVWRPRRYEQMRRRYYLLSQAERDAAVPVPEVDGGLVIHLTTEHCEAWPVRCDETVHLAFLYVLEAARWQFELSREVLGMPLVKAG